MTDLTELYPTPETYIRAYKSGETDTITSWLSPDIELTDSPIEGIGIRTKRWFNPGRVLAIKLGHVVNEKAIIEYADVIRGSHQQIGADEFLTGLTADEVRLNLVSYNHSCEPNAKIFIPRGFSIAYLVARVDVEAGDEITTDYSVSHDSVTHRIDFCNCGSGLCRRVIDPTTDWTIPELQQRNAGDFPDYLQQKIDNIAT